MRQEQLKELFDSLTIEEKVGQLIQLNGKLFRPTEKEAIVTGPLKDLGIQPDTLKLCGSVVNAAGANAIIGIQKNYLAQSEKKIPLMFMADVINGCRTIFPISLAQGATFDYEVVKKTAEVAALEASASGIHVTFSPMVDVVRDARWGRVMESYGEDTYLNCLFAKAMVKGYQGDMNPDTNIAACVKHFAGYGAPVAGREYNTVEVGERMLRDAYLPSYKAAIDAGCHLVMSSFNTIDGIPVTANEWLLRDVLRKEYNFDGVVISDYAAIHELITHGVAKDEDDAAKLAMEAGCDIDMMTSVYANHLKGIVENNHLDIARLDEAVMRVLELKNKLGLFENPYRGANHENEKKYHLCKEHQEFAQSVVSKSCVLLKNQNAVLPIPKNTKVALIGPYADNPNICGMWSFGVDPKSVRTMKKGFQALAQEGCVTTAQGSPLLDSETSLTGFNTDVNDASKNYETIVSDLQHAREVAEQADVIIMAIGEHPQQSGEGGSRGELSLPEVQMNVLREMKKIGKPIITLLFSGRPLVINEIEDLSDALLQCWFPGTQGGDGIAQLVYGDKNPSARLTMSFPNALGQCPVFHNECMTGRPALTSKHSQRFTSRYLDIPNEPRHVFGYGLSYSNFEYSKMTLDTSTLYPDSQIHASIDLFNNSNVEGEECVQLYIRDIVGSVTRPKKELKAFQKVILKPHEKKTITFSIHEEMLRFVRKDMKYASEPGDYHVFIGANSEDVTSCDFTLVI